MFKVDESRGIPIYQQIVEGFKYDVLAGTYGPDARLPSIRDLAIELKVNPNTIAKAFQDLEGQGIIYQKRGLGAFVSPQSREDRMKQAKRELTQHLQHIIELARQFGISSDELKTLLDSQLRHPPKAVRKEENA